MSIIKSEFKDELIETLNFEDEIPIRREDCSALDFNSLILIYLFDNIIQ
jgi:hypothetical protein